jgi:hypothetical protein
MTNVGDQAVPARTLSDPEPVGEGEYAVVVDETGPVELLSGENPAGEPVVTVRSDLDLAELAESPLLLLLEAYPRLPGFVVVDAEGAVTGALPVEVLDEFLGSGRFEPATTVMGPGGHAGDGDVPGDPRLPRARVRCRADGCGHVNTLTYADVARPPACTNPDLPAHPLAFVKA